MHTWWIPCPDAEACREWNGNPIKLNNASSRTVGKKTQKVGETDAKYISTKQTKPLPDTHRMNTCPKCLASSEFPKSAVCRAALQGVWDKNAHSPSEKTHTTALCACEPLLMTLHCQACSSCTFFVLHTWLLPKRALLQPPSVYADCHQGGKECTSSPMCTHKPLTPGVCLNLLVCTVCVLLVHRGKCFD